MPYRLGEHLGVGAQPLVLRDLRRRQVVGLQERGQVVGRRVRRVRLIDDDVNLRAQKVLIMMIMSDRQEKHAAPASSQRKRRTLSQTLLSNVLSSAQETPHHC